jgi:excinuclease ABC subunit C
LCLAFHIGQCLGPCAGKVDEAVYKTLVEEVKLFLDGKREELTEFIGSRMKAASERRDFEEAERLRRRMEALAAVRKERISYRPHEELEELKSILGLESMPDHIEAFDVSNIMGELAVGSMIYFHKGRPKRGAYRRFRIKTVSAIDDYAMMREVVRRRYKRVLEERGEVPGLVLIDGGRGHLQAALEELGRLGMAVPVVAIAKEYEKLYTKGRDPIVLPKDSKALHLLQRIRDEAHRFAIAYHKLLMSKGDAHSALDEIEGIGPKRLRALLLRFGSVEDIKKASKDELLKVRGMNDKAAQAIISHFSR